MSAISGSGGGYPSQYGVGGNNGTPNPNAYDSHPGDNTDVASGNNGNPGAYDTYLGSNGGGTSNPNAYDSHPGDKPSSGGNDNPGAYDPCMKV